MTRKAFARLLHGPRHVSLRLRTRSQSFGNLFSGQAVAPPPVEDAQHDAFIALQQWVEHGVAPTRIIATKYVDDQPALGVQMTRPICAFPQLPRYAGQGNTTDAANFVCVNDNSANNPMPASEFLQ